MCSPRALTSTPICDRSHLSTPMDPTRCLPWEAFLQRLKRIFEMSNYKSAAYHTGVFWAVKAVMNYRDPNRASWHDDVVDPMTDSWLLLAELTLSPLLQALQREPELVLRVRPLRSVRRERCCLTVGVWVLVQQGDMSIIARVRDIMQVEISQGEGATAVVRIWVDGCCEPREGMNAELWAPKADMDQCMLVKYELTYISIARRQQHDEHDVYLF
jgi:hypothetical protein